MLKHSLFFLFLGAIGCTSNQRESDENLTNFNITEAFQPKPVFVDTSKDEGWGGDIRLSFVTKTDNDTSIVYKVISTLESKSIGFEVAVPKEGHIKLVFKSLGEPSDNFIRFLKNLYLSKRDSLIKLKSLTSVDCIHMGDEIDSLHQQTKGVYTSTHFCKLFFQGKRDEDYAELYFNINDDEHWIELNEKDIDYRDMIIKFLTAE